MERADARVLVVEDEPKVLKALDEGLRAAGYEATLASTGEDALALTSRGDFDLVLLDWMLPQRSGLEVLTALRQQSKRTPVLILTARDALEDKVTGLDAGADDYMVKPFAFPELLARVRALVRRGRGDPAVRLRAGDLELDRAARSAARGGRPIELTPREFDLLEYLLRHQGAHVSREMLARDVWKSKRDATLDNVIDVYIGRLRRRIDPDPLHRMIHTLRGVGFLLRVDAP